MDLLRGTIASLSRDLAERRTTVRRVVEAQLAQLDRWEPRVKAWAHVDHEGARAQAEALDAGPIRGPLHGVPVGIKDIIDVAGLPTRCGSELTPPLPASCDAALVARLRAAGAVILGKTVTTPFAYLDPAATRNPWSAEHTPGGSSSGSAAAVGAGMCRAAIGTQTGGSLIRPAAYCGVASIKPTYGAISTEGVFPLAPSLDHPGPMARTVADLRILMSVFAPDVVPAPSAATRAPLLGWLDDDVFGAGSMPRVEEHLRGVVRAAFSELLTLGAAVQEVGGQDLFAGVLEMHLRIMSSEAARAHAERGFESRGAYPPRIAELIAQGRRVTADQEAEARAFRGQFQQRILERMGDCDALALPSTPAVAPASLATTGDGSFNYPWSLAGFPVATLPVGVIEGLPVGLQLVGRPQGDAALLEAAAWCEERLGFSAESPPLQSAES